MSNLNYRAKSDKNTYSRYGHPSSEKGYRHSTHNMDMSRTHQHQSESHRHKERYRDKHKSASSYLNNEHDKLKKGSVSDSLEDCDDNNSDFDWEAYRSSLNRIFFTDTDPIKVETPDYHSFWAFLKKFQAFNKMKRTTKKLVTNVLSKTVLDLPACYDKRYRINLALAKNMDEMRKIASTTTKGRELTVTRLSQFKYILLCYMDFCQKQKFNKLRQLKKTQENLPIFKYKQEVIKAVHQHPVVVIAGDTGCGKSTQVPRYLLDAGFTNIACTQPRRIACMSLSKRVAYETLNEYGSKVGYQIRFEKHKTQHTRILFLTEGLLLRQMETDPELSAYTLIILDEVHERHLHMDFLLGVLRCLVQHRKDLKVVLMSATINIELFSEYFGSAPVVKVPGRLYPIKLNYMPAKNPETKTERLDPSPYVRILQMIDNKYPASERGDMLIFMSGMSEIQIVVEAVKAYAENKQRWIVVPLHSALSIAEQDKVFDVAPEGARKCVVSTNIAETSVTIDGIRFVVDSGKAKEMNYFSQFKMQRLQEFWVSKASAEQRKGRAGRTGPGICYRLYTEQDYEAFDDYTMPEIHKVPLDSLVLQMIAMGLSDVRTFSFIEAPSSASIEYAVQSLKEHGALTQSEKLTPIGQMLGKLPVEVVLGKMLIMGCIFNIVEPVTTMAAALAIQSPFTNYAYRDPDVLLARKNLESSHGDSFTLLNCFNEWLQLKAGRGTSSRRWCKTRGLEEQRFYEITKLRQQFRQLLSSHGLLEKKPDLQTSTERRQYYGEVQRLKRMKREYHSAAPRKRKVLKRESNHEIEGFHGHSSDEEKAVDIRDIDFHLAHSTSTLREEVEATQLTHKHVILLKLILSSGLYPQLAIVDENNSFRPNTDQVFHTKDKPFVVLHPVGVFASDPELLQLKDLDVMSSEESKDTQQVQTSAKHQLLTYVTLMESKNKPYIINTTRVPALQTLLLFAHALDTSADLQRVVADGWLEVTFIDTDQAHGTISGVIQIRRAWAELVEKRLSDISGKHTEVPAMSETKLERRLQALMYTEIPYKLRRVLAAERQHMYLGSRAGELSTGENPFSPGEQCELDAVKGGLQVTDYLTYGCLDCSSHSTAFLSSVWTCPSCECKMVVSELQRLQHENSCGMTEGEASKVEEEEEEEDDGPVNPLKKSYYCEPCNKNFKFTSVEILKHKKQHAQ